MATFFCFCFLLSGLEGNRKPGLWSQNKEEGAYSSFIGCEAALEASGPCVTGACSAPTLSVLRGMSSGVP